MYSVSLNYISEIIIFKINNVNQNPIRGNKFMIYTVKENYIVDIIMLRYPVFKSKLHRGGSKFTIFYQGNLHRADNKL